MNENALSPYLRLISQTGNTRHPGGLRATDLLLKKTRLTKKWRVLDVGCGAGHTSAYIAKKYGCFVAGVDVSDHALAHARALYGAKPYFNRLHFEKSELFDLPFSDCYFDLVLCESVLLFVQEKQKALAEMSRVLKPGGFLLLNELCLEEGPHLNDVKKYFSRSEFGGYLCKVKELVNYFESAHWILRVEDQVNFSIKEQLKADLSRFGNMKGLLQVLELAHRCLTDKQFQSDAWRVAIFLLNRPPKMFSSLVSLRLLAQKTAAL